MALFDHGLERPGDADTVTTHDTGFALPGFVEEISVELLAVLGAQFEHVAHLDGATDFQGQAGGEAQFPGAHGPKVGPAGHLDIALDLDMTEVEPVLVGSRG